MQIILRRIFNYLLVHQICMSSFWNCQTVKSIKRRWAWKFAIRSTKNCLHLLPNMIMAHKTNIEQIKLKYILDKLNHTDFLGSFSIVIGILSQKRKAKCAVTLTYTYLRGGNLNYNFDDQIMYVCTYIYIFKLSVSWYSVMSITTS